MLKNYHRAAWTELFALTQTECFQKVKTVITVCTMFDHASLLGSLHSLSPLTLSEFGFLPTEICLIAVTQAGGLKDFYPHLSFFDPTGSTTKRNLLRNAR